MTAFNKHFHFEPVPDFTGVMQFAIDQTGEANIADRIKVTRGEAFKVESEKLANSLAMNSYFSHVAADTPLGQPEEYKHRPKGVTAPATPTPPAEEGKE